MCRCCAVSVDIELFRRALRVLPNVCSLDYEVDEVGVRVRWWRCGCFGKGYGKTQFPCANELVDRYKEWMAFKAAAPDCLLPDLVEMIGEYI